MEDVGYVGAVFDGVDGGIVDEDSSRDRGFGAVGYATSEDVQKGGLAGTGGACVVVCYERFGRRVRREH